jgi:DNA-binding IclR family transcriptional regulator
MVRDGIITGGAAMAYELQSLERALDLLSLLASRGALRLNAICDELDANQTTMLRTLRVLERRGLVRRDIRFNEYSLGTRLAELGHAAISGIDVPTSLRPWTTALSQRFSSTVHVGMLRAGMVTIIDKVDAMESIVRYSTLGTRMPLHATAVGKAVLALVGMDRSEQIGLTTPLSAYTRHTIVDLDRLRADVRAIAPRGYSVEREEYQIGFACNGVAFTVGGEVFGMSISGQMSDEDTIRERGEALHTALAEFIEQFRGAATDIGPS